VEIVAGAFMILLGVGIAALVAIAYAIQKRESEGRGSPRQGPRDRNAIAASILVQLARMGGASAERAGEIVRVEARLVAPITPGIDIRSWAEAYARDSTPGQREWLLDAAVRTALATGNSFPVEQYNALVDLNFALGFQTDALARLRTRYSFEYEDHAKRGRPREADRAGGSTPMFIRPTVDRQKLLGTLGLKADAGRQEIISAYRRLAAQQHPDRFHLAPEEDQQTAALRFMEITEAYEKLLATVGEVDSSRKSG
jgi:hypothetical protein